MQVTTYFQVVCFTLLVVQIHLQGVSNNCQDWLSSELSLKLNNFTNTLIQVMNQCECNFEIDYFNQSEFRCSEMSPNFVTFSGLVTMYDDQTAYQVLNTLSNWVRSQTSVSILEDTLLLDKECDVFIRDCHPPEILPQSKFNIPVAAIIGSSSAFAAAIVVLTIIFLYFIGARRYV
jgi:hypothetical protein